jgi:hypothetical protein
MPDSAVEFRRFADECLRWAETTPSDKDRRDFLRMAEAWLHAAALLEAQQPVPTGQCRILGDSAA